jgi:hypothetical protein
MLAKDWLQDMDPTGIVIHQIWDTSSSDYIGDQCQHCSRRS